MRRCRPARLGVLVPAPRSTRTERIITANSKEVRDDFIKFVSERHAQVAMSTFLGNCLIEFASTDLRSF